MSDTKTKAPSKSKKEPVRLREKELANGSTSLYLDIYVDGKRSYEFLKLYLVNPATPIDKRQNKETLMLAHSIKAQRQIQIQNKEFGFVDQNLIETPFLDYFRKMCEIRKGNKESQGNWGNWYSCLKHLERYCTEKTTFKDVDADFIEGFKDYIDGIAKDAHKRKFKSETDEKPLSQNSKVSYFNKLRACVNQAFEDRILPVNPLRGVDGYKAEETERVYLTIDELKALIKAECKYPSLKRAFLFGCLTGIRKSDIEKMTWGEVQQFDKFTRIVFKQKKTGGQEYLDINYQAIPYLGERKADNVRVFSGFKYNGQTLLELTRWCMKAGITKDVTFHSSRHTCAVMMLNIGADIYTVSKLLGHKNIQTTQIYAKVLDRRKQDAVNLIPDLTL